MILLPNEFYNASNNEKIFTYQFLANIGCPVFQSVLFDENEELTEEKIIKTREILNSDYCTIRYQYLKPSITPIRGGNKIFINLEELQKKQVVGTQMWLLQPIDRTKNLYGINMYVNKSMNIFAIECVGKGFDVSDINRGDITPQEVIMFNYPIDMGWQNEWWKYIKMTIINKTQFEKDKIVRLNKLQKLGITSSLDIFDTDFKPLDYNLIDTLINYVKIIDENWCNSMEYTISISMNDNSKLVFFYIQTPKGKTKILRRT